MQTTKIPIKISSQGQITLPKKVIAILGLNTNSLADMTVESDRLVITKRSNPIAKYVGVFKGKIDLTAQEFIKIRKEEAKLI